ncbi:hypothetical protein NUSPORA_00745 [Nucleospora cyclopteri]
MYQFIISCTKSFFYIFLIKNIWFLFVLNLKPISNRNDLFKQKMILRLVVFCISFIISYNDSYNEERTGNPKRSHGNRSKAPKRKRYRNYKERRMQQDDSEGSEQYGDNKRRDPYDEEDGNKRSGYEMDPNEDPNEDPYDDLNEDPNEDSNGFRNGPYENDDEDDEYEYNKRSNKGRNRKAFNKKDNDFPSDTEDERSPYTEKRTRYKRRRGNSNYRNSLKHKYLDDENYEYEYN